MKERIVIDEDLYVKHFQEREIEFQEEEMCSGGNPEEWWHYKKEQVPETWEELKELCKKENISKCEDEIKIKWHNNTSLYFYEKYGEIICKDEDSCIEMTIGYDRTPAQMWNIIKNLIGEE